MGTITTTTVPADWPGAGRHQPWIGSVAQRPGRVGAARGVGGRQLILTECASSKPLQAIAHDVRGSLEDIDDIIERSAPIIDSQVNSGNEIVRWAANLNTLAACTKCADRSGGAKRRHRLPIK